MGRIKRKLEEEKKPIVKSNPEKVIVEPVNTVKGVHYPPDRLNIDTPEIKKEKEMMKSAPRPEAVAFEGIGIKLYTIKDGDVKRNFHVDFGIGFKYIAKDKLLIEALRKDGYKEVA